MSVCSDAFLISHHKRFYLSFFPSPLSAVSHGIILYCSISLPGGISPKLYRCCSDFSSRSFELFLEDLQRYLLNEHFKILYFVLFFLKWKKDLSRNLNKTDDPWRLTLQSCMHLRASGMFIIKNRGIKKHLNP